MLPVAAKLGLPNIVNYHVPDLFASVVLGQKILGERTLALVSASKAVNA
jgi:hypothetical protein